MGHTQTKALGWTAAVPEMIPAQIIEAVAGIRFGVVEIVIQKGCVVQIERNEKVHCEPSL